MNRFVKHFNTVKQDVIERCSKADEECRTYGINAEQYKTLNSSQRSMLYWLVKKGEVKLDEFGWYVVASQYCEECGIRLSTEEWPLDVPCPVCFPYWETGTEY